MKIGVIIPDRGGDRPEFLSNCLRLIDQQTLRPEHIELVNYKPESERCDITQRYRRGYDALRNKGFDVIAFMENDDWYSKDYLEIMAAKWVEFGKPNLLGHNYTIYYHLKLMAFFTMDHDERSSAMNTLIKPDIEINWPVDHEPFTDMHLWYNLKGGITFRPQKHICIGMKHGVTMTGGTSHINHLDRYERNKDDGFLRNTVDKESYEFYLKLHENLLATS